MNVGRNEAPNLIAWSRIELTVAFATPGSVEVGLWSQAEPTEDFYELRLEVFRPDHSGAGAYRSQLAVPCQQPAVLFAGAASNLFVLQFRTAELGVKSEEPHPPSQRSEHGVTEEAVHGRSLLQELFRVPSCF
jgi:hypothetical protein